MLFKTLRQYILKEKSSSLTGILAALARFNRFIVSTGLLLTLLIPSWIPIFNLAAQLLSQKKSIFWLFSLLLYSLSSLRTVFPQALHFTSINLRTLIRIITRKVVDVVYQVVLNWWRCRHWAESLKLSSPRLNACPDLSILLKQVWQNNFQDSGLVERRKRHTNWHVSNVYLWRPMLLIDIQAWPGNLRLGYNFIDSILRQHRIRVSEDGLGLRQESIDVFICIFSIWL